MGKPTMETIELSGDVFNAVNMRAVSEHEAIRIHPGYDHNQVRNAWKQANGLSVPKHTRQGLIEKLDKENNKPAIVAMANEMGLEFEGDANKLPIIELIVDKQMSEKE